MFKMILAAVVALSFSTFAFADDHSAAAATGEKTTTTTTESMTEHKGMDKAAGHADKKAKKMVKKAKTETKKEEHSDAH